MIKAMYPPLDQNVIAYASVRIAIVLSWRRKLPAKYTCLRATEAEAQHHEQCTEVSVMSNMQILKALGNTRVHYQARHTPQNEQQYAQ